LVGLVEPLEVRGPRSVENGLGLFLLLLTDVEKEAGLLLTKLLSHAAKLRLLHTKTGPSLSGLNAKLTVLGAEPANALSNLSRLLRALKPQAACRFGASHTHLGLALPELTVLLSQLPGELFGADTHLRGPLSNIGLGGSARQAKLPGLLGKLPGELGGVHAGAGRELLNVHARLGLSLGVGCRKLLSGKPRSGRHFGARQPELPGLQCPRLRKLLGRKAKLSRGLSRLLPLRSQSLRLLRGLLLCG